MKTLVPVLVVYLVGLIGAGIAAFSPQVLGLIPGHGNRNLKRALIIVLWPVTSVLIPLSVVVTLIWMFIYQPKGKQ